MILIKVSRPLQAPQVLIDNKDEWTQNLQDAIDLYNGYSNIPSNVKSNLLRHYKHSEIQDILFQCSHNKCVFCECIPSEGGNIEVEHFAPKSKYPELTFEWTNMLPVCRKCNLAKGQHDTLEEPIVNPSIEEPSEYFTFMDLQILPKDELANREKANRTIEVCDLNATWLLKARADLLLSLSIFEETLKSWLNEINNARTARKKRNRILRLISAFDIIINLAKSDKKYSAFCTNFISNRENCVQAKLVIDEFEKSN